ncbi:hypothetical protein [Paramaledivibacter caminithermalis]|jgi:hypothetical protein|uniref:Uncharacterized protein n=1 Tax=Paramaledivibacter caminithermalis (strain DSM 15212 / CIP 107654 / DViRD3) TaxID=1121301 RepID=A0A1M6M9A5_PARC5|nr:hypothetical protein [Paramaledivibacter caminithermalis]SHJ80029.1 hypothetical protein SAMN02745912_01145 [Paramaledivibacter caminithermalis DSM 15212]
MIIDSISNLKELLLGKSLKICILDNNSVEFLNIIEEYVSSQNIFNGYDLILVPEWIRAEIEDSEYRKAYVNRLLEIEDIYFYYVDELEYLELINYKDADLFNLFLYSCGSVKPLESFIKRYILKNKPIEELDAYETWLNILYKEGFKGQILSSGRERKKNAGEISICVLSLILAYFYIDSVENITIFTNDRDAYDFNKYAINKLHSHKDYKNIEHKPITFKSNDFLIYELFNKGLLTIESEEDMSKFRNERWINYARKKHDNSIEEGYKLVKNAEFMEMIKDNTLYIVF